MLNDSRPDILFVTHRVPYPPDKGDRIRNYHLLRFLAKSCRVHLAALADEPVSEETLGVLNALCERVEIVPLGSSRWLKAGQSFLSGRTISEGAFRSGQLDQIIGYWIGDTHFQGAIASASSVAGYLQRKPLAGTPRIVDLVDVDSQKWLDYAAAFRAPKSWLYRIEGSRMRSLEQSFGSWAALTLVSEAEVELFRPIAPAANMMAVTNGVDLEYFHPRHQKENGCVFVGALDYRPNIDAACWFVDTIWPALRERQPGCTLKLVGRKPASVVEKLVQFPGVEVIGQVPDVRPYIYGAAVVLAPLRVARGLQNKVLEALAMGKPVVASPQALGGFGHREELPALCARNTEEWVAHISMLLDDESERRQRGNAGRRYAETYHDWSACLAPFGQLLTSRQLESNSAERVMANV